MKQSECSRCPDSPKECTDRRHNCPGCNGVAIVRNGPGRDTWISCPICIGYQYTGELPGKNSLLLDHYGLTEGVRQRRVRNTGKKTQKR